MGWLKRQRPEPEPDPGPVVLGDRHLDTVLEPGVYTQLYSVHPAKALGYPWDGVAGMLVILPWNPRAGNLIAVYHSWDRGSAKRTLYNGVWRPWLDFQGKAVQ